MGNIGAIPVSLFGKQVGVCDCIASIGYMRMVFEFGHQYFEILLVGILISHIYLNYIFVIHSLVFGQYKMQLLEKDKRSNEK